MTTKADSALSWLTTVIALVAATLFSNFLVEFFYLATRLGSGHSEVASGDLSRTFRVTVAMLLQVTILAIIIRVSGYRITEYFGIVAPSAGAIVLTLTALALIFLLTYLLGIRGRGPVILLWYLHSVREAREAGIVPLFITATVFVAPCCEEIIFRGFLFRGLSNTRIGATGAVLFTTIFWSALHLPSPPQFIAFLVAFGIVLGWLRARTHSTPLTALLHGGVNLVVMAAAYNQ